MAKSKELGIFDVNLNGENNSDGYILEVRLAYPDELHELHNDYPLATEKLKISYNTLLKNIPAILQADMKWKLEVLIN